MRREKELERGGPVGEWYVTSSFYWSGGSLCALITRTRAYTHTRTHSGLSDAELQDLGVFDSNHRRTILHKVQSGGMDSDLDNVLTDLTSVIADLEAFTVVRGMGGEERCEGGWGKE